MLVIKREIKILILKLISVLWTWTVVKNKYGETEHFQGNSHMFKYDWCWCNTRKLPPCSLVSLFVLITVTKFITVFCISSLCSEGFSVPFNRSLIARRPLTPLTRQHIFVRGSIVSFPQKIRGFLLAVLSNSLFAQTFFPLVIRSCQVKVRFLRHLLCNGIRHHWSTTALRACFTSSLSLSCFYPRRTFCILRAATMASSSESDSLWEVELWEPELQGEEHSGEQR